MHKILLIPFISATLFLAVSCDGVFVEKDEKDNYSLKADSYEEDDELGYRTKNVIKSGGDKQKHSIFDSKKTANDIDYIWLEAVAGKCYKIETYPSEGDSIDTFLELRTATAVVVTSDDNSGTDSLALINWWECEVSGSYMILVTGKETGYYGIDVKEFNGGKVFAPYTQNFEAASVSPWTNWVRDGFNFHGGLYSIKTPKLADDESSVLQLMVEVPSPGKTLAFYWQVSSEEGKDYFRFFVDGVEVKKISGIVKWTSVTHELSAGTHLIKWEYRKNGSKSDPNGNDCGWLDDIIIQ